jgi:hypothetical protein
MEETLIMGLYMSLKDYLAIISFADILILSAFFSQMRK